ncbi:MAG: hydroxymethylbilane synthase [Pseudomonadota bacterium]
MKIIVGTRKSQIPLLQSRYVAKLLEQAGGEVEIHPIQTVVDSLDVALSGEGGSQMFVKEIDEALKKGEIDVAVHDMKDVGIRLPSGISMAAVSAREDPREAFISIRAGKLQALSKGSRIGVTSRTRHIQIAKLRPDLLIIPIPAEVEGCLRSLKEEKVDAVVLASCDFIRMGFGKLVAEFIPVDKIIPEVGQGALSIQVRTDEKELLGFVKAACHNNACGVQVRAERSFLKAVESFDGVFAANAEIRPAGVFLIGFIASSDGSVFVTDKESGPVDKAADIGISLAKKLLKKFPA